MTVNNNRKPKTGTLANAYRAPLKDSVSSIDWDAVMRNHQPPEAASEPIPEKLQLTLDELDRANRGLQNHYKDGQPKPKKSRRTGQGRHAPFDVDEAVRLYTEEHLTPKEIAEKVGVLDGSTVIRYLKRAEVYDPQKYRPGGSHARTRKLGVRPPETYEQKTVCLQGHDLTLPGALYRKVKKNKRGKIIKNGSDCVRCKREREQAKKGGIQGWAKGKHDD